MRTIFEPNNNFANFILNIIELKQFNNVEMTIFEIR